MELDVSPKHPSVEEEQIALERAATRAGPLDATAWPPIGSNLSREFRRDLRRGLTAFSAVRGDDRANCPPQALSDCGAVEGTG